MIEQDNLYFCIVKTSKYEFDYNDIFLNGIKLINDEPTIINEWLNNQVVFNDVLIININDLRKLILDNVEVPLSYQFTFTVLENTLAFEDGTLIDLSSYLVHDYKTFKTSQNLNPNITFNQKEKVIIDNVKKELKTTINPCSQIRRFVTNGEESNTIMKFLVICFQGNLIISDYKRDKDDKLIFDNLKRCLILYNGTKYPDLVCIFLEDAETIEKKGKRSFSEYCDFIWKNNRRFEHLEFQVEAEFNVASFKDHDTSKIKVLQSKYIFCENKNKDLYKSKYGVEIPVISIKDFNK